MGSVHQSSEWAVLPFVIYVLFQLVMFLPGLAALSRRLHDTGKSGWYFLLILIPIIGAIILLIFLASDSQEGPNKWGPNPKGVGNREFDPEAFAHSLD